MTVVARVFNTYARLAKPCHAVSPFQPTAGASPRLPAPAAPSHGCAPRHADAKLRRDLSNRPPLAQPLAHMLPPRRRPGRLRSVRSLPPRHEPLGLRHVAAEQQPAAE